MIKLNLYRKDVDIYVVEEFYDQYQEIVVLANLMSYRFRYLEDYKFNFDFGNVAIHTIACGYNNPYAGYLLTFKVWEKTKELVEFDVKSFKESFVVSSYNKQTKVQNLLDPLVYLKEDLMKS